MRRKVRSWIWDARWWLSEVWYWNIYPLWHAASDWLLHPWRETRRNGAAVRDLYRLHRSEEQAVREDIRVIYKTVYEHDEAQEDFALMLIRIAHEVGVDLYDGKRVPDKQNVDRMPNVQELEAMGIELEDQLAVAEGVEHGFYKGTPIDPRY